MQSNPAIAIGTIGTIIGTIIVLLRSFGLDITTDQESALKDFALIVIPLVTGLVIRGFVISPATATEKVAEAHKSGQVDGPVPSVKA